MGARGAADRVGHPAARRRLASFAEVAVLALLCIAASLTVACGDGGDTQSADVTGYWRLTTNEETTIRIDGADDAYAIAGLSPSEEALLPADDGSYMIVNWRWHGRQATIHVALSENGEHLTCSVTDETDADAGTPSPVLTMEFERATGDPDLLESRVRDQMTLYAGAQTEEGIHALQVAVQSWIVNHDGKAPAADDVRPGGAIETYLDAWPENPYTRGPMQPGDGPGEYTYERTNDERGYRFTGHLEDGDFTVP